MSVTSTDKNYDNLTISLVADFEAPIDRVWQMLADPRLLEQWWGPPGYPATVEEHSLVPGGSVVYYMTSPENEKYRGYWNVVSVEPPTSLVFLDGFADKDGKPAEGMPVNTTHVGLRASGTGTRMELRSVFESREQMEQTINMGAIEGLTAAVGQIDALLAA